MLLKTDIRPFHNTFKLMRMVYGYPKKMDGRSLKMYSIITILLHIGFFTFITLVAFLHLIVVIKDKLPVDSTEDITMIVGGLTTLYAAVMNSSSYKLYQRLVSLLTDFQKFGKPPNFDKAAQRSNLLSASYFYCCFGGHIVYGIISMKESKQCYLTQETVDTNLFCGVYTTAWFPFNVNMKFIFFFQMCLCIMLLTPCALCCHLFLEVVELLSTHIEHLQDFLGNVFQQSSNKRQEILGFCIEYHKYILSVASETEEGFKKVLGFMSLFWAICFGAIANQIQHSKPLGAVVYLICYVSALAILSRAGQRIMDKTSGVTDNMYSMNWYLGTAQEMRNLKFMIARSQVVCTLPATPFGRYEYALFVTIIKTAYSYVTVMRGG